MTNYVQTGDSDGTYPFRISAEDDITDWLIRISTSGVTETKGVVASGGSLSGGAVHLPAAGSTGFHADSSGNIGSGGTTSTDSASLFLVDASGNLSARTAVFHPKDSSSKALTLQDDKGSSANLLELIANTTLIASFDASHGTLFFNGGFLPGGETVGSITAQKNNWFVGGDKFKVRADLTGNQDLTGITAITNAVLVLTNGDNTDTLTLKHDSASSTAANRFYLPGNADKALSPRQAVLLHYDATDSRWHVIG